MTAASPESDSTSGRQHGRRALRGAFAYGIRQIVMMGVGAAANLAITRLLLPADFGRIAVLTLVVNFGKLLAVGGIGVYLVQRARDISRDELTDVVSFQFWLYAALQVVLLGVAFGSLLFATDHLVWFMLSTMVVSLLFGVLRSGSMILLERRLEFAEMATIEVTEQVINTVVMVGLAVLGFHAWSVAIAAIPAAIISWLLAERYARYTLRVRIPHFTRELKEGLVFCAHMFSPYVLGAARIAALPVIVGGMIGLSGVGYCERATFIGTLPFGILSGVQQKVLFSYTARIQSDTASVRRMLEEATYASAVLDKILYLPLVAFTPEIVQWLFTARWAPSVPLIEIIAWGCAAFGAFNGVAFPVVAGLGEPKFLGISNGVMLVLTWVLLAPLVHRFGITGYAYVSLTLWLVAPYLYRVLRDRVGGFAAVRPALVPFAAFTVAVLAARWLNARSLTGVSIPLRVALWSVAGIAVYLVALAVLDGRRFVALAHRLVAILRARKSLEGIAAATSAV